MQEEIRVECGRGELCEGVKQKGEHVTVRPRGSIEDALPTTLRTTVAVHKGRVASFVAEYNK